MKKIRIYFYKHGFQTDGVSLWVVQIGRKKYFTKKFFLSCPSESKFSRVNPHAYIIAHPTWRVVFVSKKYDKHFAVDNIDKSMLSGEKNVYHNIGFK